MVPQGKCNLEKEYSDLANSILVREAVLILGEKVAEFSSSFFWCLVLGYTKNSSKNSILNIGVIVFMIIGNITWLPRVCTWCMYALNQTISAEQISTIWRPTYCKLMDFLGYLKDIWTLYLLFIITKVLVP